MLESPDGIADAGVRLSTALGSAYVTIGTITGQGSFRGWKWNQTTKVYDRVNTPMPPFDAGDYAWYFAQRGASPLLIPLHGNVPS